MVRAGGLVLGAVEAKVPVAEGGVHIRAVVRPLRVVVDPRPEEAARGAHPRGRDPPALLELADDLHQPPEEDRLLDPQVQPSNISFI